jgi:hypothetical protein
MPILKPNDELIVSAAAVGVVYAIFTNTLPPSADIRADQPGNMNTFHSVKSAVLTSVFAIGALALIGKSPTVFTIGGAVIVIEAWKNHAFNFGVSGQHSGYVG